jgi:hypothetical protein
LEGLTLLFVHLLRAAGEFIEDVFQLRRALLLSQFDSSIKAKSFCAKHERYTICG